MAGKELVVHTRLVIEALEKARGNKLDEITIAFVIFAKKNEMVRAFGIGTTVFMIVGRDVNLAANDWLHAMRRRLVIEIRRREQVAVIGNRYCGHAAACGFFGEFADFTSAVKQGVIGVEMQVYEICGGHENLF